MPRGAKMSLVLNDPKQVESNSNTTFKGAPQLEKKLLILYAKEPMRNHSRSTPDKESPHVTR